MLPLQGSTAFISKARTFETKSGNNYEFRDKHVNILLSIQTVGNVEINWRLPASNAI